MHFFFLLNNVIAATDITAIKPNTLFVSPLDGSLGSSLFAETLTLILSLLIAEVTSSDFTLTQRLYVPSFSGSPCKKYHHLNKIYTCPVIFFES